MHARLLGGGRSEENRKQIVLYKKPPLDRNRSGCCRVNTLLKRGEDGSQGEIPTSA